jgi:hypothetical protein
MILGRGGGDRWEGGSRQRAAVRVLLAEDTEKRDDVLWCQVNWHMFHLLWPVKVSTRNGLALYSYC